jgi:hypothetical protein
MLNLCKWCGGHFGDKGFPLSSKFSLSEFNLFTPRLPDEFLNILTPHEINVQAVDGFIYIIAYHIMLLKMWKFGQTLQRPKLMASMREQAGDK